MRLLIGACLWFAVLVPFFLIARSDRVTRSRKALWLLGGVLLLVSMQFLSVAHGYRWAPTAVAIALTSHSHRGLASGLIVLAAPWAFFGAFRFSQRGTDLPPNESYSAAPQVRSSPETRDQALTLGRYLGYCLTVAILLSLALPAQQVFAPFWWQKTAFSDLARVLEIVFTPGSWVAFGAGGHRGFYGSQEFSLSVQINVVVYLLMGVVLWVTRRRSWFYRLPIVIVAYGAVYAVAFAAMFTWAR